MASRPASAGDGADAAPQTANDSANSEHREEQQPPSTPPPDAERFRRIPLSPSAKAVGTAYAYMDRFVGGTMDRVSSVCGNLEPCYLEIIPLVWGFVLFHGSQFSNLIIAIAAVRFFGWHRFRAAFSALSANHRSACVAHDSPATPSSESTPPPGLRHRKRGGPTDRPAEPEIRRALFITQSIDPARVGDVLIGITEALFALIAALRLQISRGIALGVALAEVIDVTIGPAVIPLMRAHLPKSVGHWVPVILRHGLRVTVLVLCLVPILSRFVTGAYAAALGASYIVESGSKYLRRINKIDEAELAPASPKRAALFFVITAAGLLIQLFIIRGLPHWLAIILFPFTLANWLVSFFAA